MSDGSDVSVASAIAVLAASMGAAAGALWGFNYVTGRPLPAGLSRVLQRVPNMNLAQQIARYATTNRWNALDTAPAGAKRLPILGASLTQPVPGYTDWHRIGVTKDGVDGCLSVLRAALQDAGRGDEDVRCVLYRMAEETSWLDGHMWGWNPMNFKAPGVYASSATVLDAGGGYVLDTHYPSASHIFLLVDRLQSFDAYYGFDTFGDGLQSAAQWFERNGYNSGASGGVRGAYIAGDKDGLTASEIILAQRGFSTGYTVAAAQVRPGRFWDRCAALCGATWVR